MPAGVKIQNLDDVLARLDRLPATARRELDEVLTDVADTNAALIRAQAGRAGRQASAASRTVFASGSTISAGGPFVMGSIFGGQGRPTTQQFQPYVGGNGYWFFTSLSDGYPAALQRFADVVDAVAREWDGA